jgi:hypothetical protein
VAAWNAVPIRMRIDRANIRAVRAFKPRPNHQPRLALAFPNAEADTVARPVRLRRGSIPSYVWCGTDPRRRRRRSTIVRCPDGPIGRVACTHHCVHALRHVQTPPHPPSPGHRCCVPRGRRSARAAGATSDRGDAPPDLPDSAQEGCPAGPAPARQHVGVSRRLSRIRSGYGPRRSGRGLHPTARATRAPDVAHPRSRLVTSSG